MEISNTQCSSTAEEEPHTGLMTFNFITLLSSAKLPWMQTKSQATSDYPKKEFLVPGADGEVDTWRAGSLYGE